MHFSWGLPWLPAQSPYISAEAYPGLQHISEGSGRVPPPVYVTDERVATASSSTRQRRWPTPGQCIWKLRVSLTVKDFGKRASGSPWRARGSANHTYCDLVRGLAHVKREMRHSAGSAMQEGARNMPNPGWSQLVPQS